MNKKLRKLTGAMMIASIMGGAAVLPQNILPFNMISASAVSETEQTIDGVRYKLNDDFTASIVGIDDSLTSLTTPETVVYNGITYTVNKIDNYCCGRRTALETLTIGENIEYIGDAAFANCSKLSSVTINGAPEMHWLAFGRCSQLKEVYLNDDITSLANSMFLDCESLETINIPSNLESIGYHTFDGCTSLTVISIPDSVQTISDFTFLNCTSLTSISISDSVKDIPQSAFSGCTSITSIELPSDLETIESAAFSGCTSLTSISIPDSVQNIGSNAFTNCTSLTSISIPDAVQNIYGNTFSGCTSLTYVDLPDNLTKIWSSAFENCTSLETPTFPITLESIGDSAFENTPSMTGTLVISENVSEIGMYCFRESGFSEVYSNSSASIGYAAFSYTPNLEEATLTGNEKLNTSFCSCENLSNINVPLSANEDWDGCAFSDCVNLTKINNEEIKYEYDKDKEAVVFTNSDDMVAFIKTHFNASDGVGFIDSYVDYYCDEVIKRYTTPGMTDIQKAKALHDWVIYKVDYDYDCMNAKKNHCVCSIFINDTTVCEGYALGYAKIMEKAGIDTVCFSGINHAWNKCKFGDIYLNVDTCWDDYNEIRYDWFLISDKEVLEQETISHGNVDTKVPLSDYPMGDLNMDTVVGVDDYRIMQKKLSNLIELDYNQEILADLNFDGVIDNADLRLIKEKCQTRFDLNGDRKLNNNDHALLQFAIVKQLELSEKDTYKFDINNDGVIDWKDAKEMRDFLEKYCNQDKNEYYRMGDLNLDGTVDREDYNALQEYMNNKTKFEADRRLADLVFNNRTIVEEDLDRLYELTKYQIGDVNFDNVIDINDKNLIVDYIAGNETLADEVLWYADINGDGAIDNKDVNKLNGLLG